MSLISREKLLAHFSWWPDTDENKGIFESIIARQPDVDAEPVVHGKWREVEVDKRIVYCCTVCHTVAHMPNPATFGLYAYCPHCGAKMDGGVNDAVD